MSTMQKVLLGGALVALLLCSGAGLFGYYRLWPRLKEGSTEAVETEVEYQVLQSMENALVLRQIDPCAVRLAGHDLDMSTCTDTSGDSKVNIVNGDASITNGFVEINADGIDIYLTDMRFHGVPVVQDGSFRLIETDLDTGISSLLIDGLALENGFERGVNEGLQRARLVPTSVQVENGTMTLGCEAQTGFQRILTT